MKNRINPGPGQESVWDYPRPPRLEPFSGHVRIVLGGEVICDSNRVYRLLETSHPPTYYIPAMDFKDGVLEEAGGGSFCEFKGAAHYYDLRYDKKIARRAAWGYKEPARNYEHLLDKVAVYAGQMDVCYVNDELVQAQEGGFYGGWITSNIVGPFKGGIGTYGW